MASYRPQHTKPRHQRPPGTAPGTLLVHTSKYVTIDANMQTTTEKTTDQPARFGLQRGKFDDDTDRYRVSRGLTAG